MHQHRWGLILLLLITLFIGGCQQQTANAPAQQNNQPSQPAQPALHKPDVPLEFTKDPLNTKVSYYLKFNGRDDEARQIIGGPYWRGVSLIQVNDKGAEKVLVDDLPFITRARWSADGQYLGLMGADKLYIWNRQTGKVNLINEVVNTPSVIHFAFGPDGKVYTEHSNLPNDAIYDPVNNQGNPAYKISGQPFYYKEDLGDGYYAGTVVKAGTKSIAEEVYTVIIDAQGQILHRAAPGRYREHQDKALLNVGKERFGLYYVKDFKQPQAKQIFVGFIYQCAFTPEGKVIYTRPGNLDKPYLLCEWNPTTNKTRQQQVSGPFFVISTDGSTVYGSGWQQEQLEAATLAIKSSVKAVEVPDGDIRKSLWGALNTYTQWYCRPEMDDKAQREHLARWYTDTTEPVAQSALFDVTNELAFRRLSSFYYGDYIVSGRINKLAVKGERASAVIGQGVNTSSGSGWGTEAAYELIKTPEGWKVTGLSTFPDSGEHRRVQAVAEQFKKRAERGESINFTMQDSPRIYQELKGNPIKIGQIQFWRMSEPHRSPNVETANHAKVYLTAGDKTYRLLLEKKSFSWQVTGLSDKNLPGLL